MKNEKNEKERETVCQHEITPVHEKEQSIPQNGKINPPENNVRKRKFTWTPKRKEAFQKCIEANKKRIALKNDKLSDKKEQIQQTPKQVIKEEDKESVCSESSSSSECSSSFSSSTSSSSSSSSTPVKKRKKPVTRPHSTKKVTQKVKKAIKKSKQELLKSIHSIKKVLNKKPIVAETPKQSDTHETYDSDSDSYSSYNYCSPFKFI